MQLLLLLFHVPSSSSSSYPAGLPDIALKPKYLQVLGSGNGAEPQKLFYKCNTHILPVQVSCNVVAVAVGAVVVVIICSLQFLLF